MLRAFENGRRLTAVHRTFAAPLALQEAVQLFGHGEQQQKKAPPKPTTDMIAESGGIPTLLYLLRRHTRTNICLNRP